MRVRQAVDAGELRRVGPNLFDPVDTVRRYIAYRERKLIAGLGGGGSLARARQHLVVQKALIAQMERRQLEGRLIPLEQITTAWTAIAATVRTRFLAVPARAAARLGMIGTSVEVARIIREEVSAALEELSKFRVEALADPAPESAADADGRAGPREMGNLPV